MRDQRIKILKDNEDHLKKELEDDYVSDDEEEMGEGMDEDEEDDEEFHETINKI